MRRRSLTPLQERSVWYCHLAGERHAQILIDFKISRQTLGRIIREKQAELATESRQRCRLHGEAVA
jgi:hypothetical protein